MKRAGLIICVIGLLMTALSGFELITKGKIIDIGRVEITQDKRQVFDWSPLLGVSILAVGAGVYLFSKRNVRHAGT